MDSWRRRLIFTLSCTGRNNRTSGVTLPPMRQVTIVDYFFLQHTVTDTLQYVRLEGYLREFNGICIVKLFVTLPIQTLISRQSNVG